MVNEEQSISLLREIEKDFRSYIEKLNDKMDCDTRAMDRDLERLGKICGKNEDLFQ